MAVLLPGWGRAWPSTLAETTTALFGVFRTRRRLMTGTLLDSQKRTDADDRGDQALAGPGRGAYDLGGGGRGRSRRDLDPGGAALAGVSDLDIGWWLLLPGATRVGAAASVTARSASA